MKTPWDIDNKAFEPFYDTTVAIKGTPVKACVFEETFDEPFSELSPSTTCRRISVMVPKYGEGGWNRKTPPKKGDALTVNPKDDGTTCSENFVIDFVSDFVGNWKISAREVEAAV